LNNHATADFFNLKGTTALMRASQEGHVEISRLLINAGADVNRKNFEGLSFIFSWSDDFF
jgi:ankyrin repeat protein